MTLRNSRSFKRLHALLDIIALIIIVVGLPIVAVYAQSSIEFKPEPDFFIILSLLEIIFIIFLVYGLRRLAAIK